MLTLPLILASCARSLVTSFLDTSHFLGTHTKLDYGYDSSGSPTSCGLSPGWDATEPPLGPTPGLVTAGSGQTPASPPAWAFWVLGEDWDRPFPSGLKIGLDTDQGVGPRYTISQCLEDSWTSGKAVGAFRETLAWNSRGEMAGTEALNHGCRSS